MTPDAPEREVIEPEVLPPQADREDERTRPTKGLRLRTLGSALLSGLLLDLADFSTRFPAILIGVVVGALLGLYICTTQQVPRKDRVWWVAVSALYCAMPRTEFFPMATLVLVYRAARNMVVTK